MIAEGDWIATPSQTVGPFFHFGLAPCRRVGTRSPGEDGAPIVLRVRVIDGDGLPVPDAWVEVWEGGGAGRSEVGRLATDENGVCEFEIVRAVTYLNLCLFARGLLRHVITRVYFKGHPRLEGDPVLALVPAARRATLMAQSEAGDSHRWRFDVRLQGDDETVFFAL